jgi:hypothetical protein
MMILGGKMLKDLGIYDHLVTMENDPNHPKKAFQGLCQQANQAQTILLLIALFSIQICMSGCGVIQSFLGQNESTLRSTMPMPTTQSLEVHKLDYALKILGDAEEIEQYFELNAQFAIYFPKHQTSISLPIASHFQVKNLFVQGMNTEQWHRFDQQGLLKQSNLKTTFNFSKDDQGQHWLNIDFKSPIQNQYVLFLVDFLVDFQGLPHLQMKSEEGIYRSMVFPQSQMSELFPLIQYSRVNPHVKVTIPSHLQLYSSHLVGKSTWQYKADLLDKKKKEKQIDILDSSMPSDHQIQRIFLGEKKKDTYQYDLSLSTHATDIFTMTIGQYHPIFHFELAEQRSALVLSPKTKKSSYPLLEQAKQRIKRFDDILDKALPKPVQPLIFVFQASVDRPLNLVELMPAYLKGMIHIPEEYVIVEPDQPMHIRRKTDFELLKRLILQRISPWQLQGATADLLDGTAVWLAHYLLPLTTENPEEKLFFEEYIEHSFVERFITLNTYQGLSPSLLAVLELKSIKYTSILEMLDAYLSKNHLTLAITQVIDQARLSYLIDQMFQRLDFLTKVMIDPMIKPQIQILADFHPRFKKALDWVDSYIGKSIWETEIRASFTIDSDDLPSLDSSLRAPEDLYQSVSELSKQDVRRIVESFTAHNTLPLVTLDYECIQSPPQSSSPLSSAHAQKYEIRFHLEQRPYVRKSQAQSNVNQGKDTVPTEIVESTKWAIPICLSFGTQNHQAGSVCLVLDQPKKSFKTNLPSCPTWAHPNRHQRLLYYWKLKNPAPLLSAVQELTPAEWGVLPELYFALLESKDIQVDDYLALIDLYAKQSQGKISWFNEITQQLNMVSHLLVEKEAQGDFQFWVRGLIRLFLPKDMSQTPDQLENILLAFAWLGKKAVSIPNYEVELDEFLSLGEDEVEEGEYVQEPNLNYGWVQVSLLLKMAADETGDFAKKVINRLAVSEAPLLRKLCLEVLAHTINEHLFKEMLEWLVKDDGSFLAGEQEWNQGKVNHQITLSASERLMFAQMIKQPNNRKWAWEWLLSKLDVKLIETLDSKLQQLMFAWGDILCTDEGVQQVEGLRQDQNLKLNRETLEILGKNQQQIQRCLYLRKNFASSASLWFKEKNLKTLKP